MSTFNIRTKLSTIGRIGHYFQAKASDFNPEVTKTYGNSLINEVNDLYDLVEELSSEKKEVEKQNILLKELLREEMHNCDVFERAIYTPEFGWVDICGKLTQEKLRLQHEILYLKKERDTTT